MQQVVVYKWCDHPECQEEWKNQGEEIVTQDVREVEFFVYTPGRGKKPPIIRVELCDRHSEELKVLFSALYKYDMKKLAD